MNTNQLRKREIATILASLRLFQQQAENMDMAEIFPDHFINVSPLSSAEIDELYSVINITDRREIDYVTRDFVRRDCGVYGAVLSDEDCDVIIAEVQQLAEQGKFHHTGVYWIANSLAANGMIHPTLP
ncbi:hypothetical protein [Nostoc sp. ChiQUE01b]|uniref:hypothetical protein n=1 Tax=Nostoc sp. ChiQUE01b TaxID=3075376 RepID=UPI002AD4AFC2|nr:hypothetical protein [Nostoc sp. ChiQUE01b]MDZ8260583.1 hypothetical protein [Nostoc sp. ChiQUE01b]